MNPEINRTHPAKYWGETWGVSSYLPHIDLDGSDYFAMYNWLMSVFRKLGVEPNVLAVSSIKGFKDSCWRK